MPGSSSNDPMRIEISRPLGHFPPNRLEPQMESLDRTFSLAVDTYHFLAAQQPELITRNERLGANGSAGVLAAP